MDSEAPLGTVLQFFNAFLNAGVGRIIRIAIPCCIDERLGDFLKRVDAVDLLLMCHVAPIEVGQVLFNFERHDLPAFTQSESNRDHRYYSRSYVQTAYGHRCKHEEFFKNQSIKSMTYMFREQVVDLSGKKSNQVFDELANWEDVLKASSLAGALDPGQPASAEQAPKSRSG